MKENILYIFLLFFFKDKERKKFLKERNFEQVLSIFPYSCEKWPPKNSKKNHNFRCSP